MSDPSPPSLTTLLSSSSPLLPLLLTLIIFSIPLLVIFPPVPVSALDALAQTHRRLGVAPRRAAVRSPDPDRRSVPTVHSLWVYPVKSCRGVELDGGARVTGAGLEFDRAYMFARLRGAVPRKTDKATGKEDEDDNDRWEFITLRQFPRLATLSVSIFVPDPTKHSRALGPAHTHTPLLLLSFPTPHPSLLTLAAAKLSALSPRAIPQTEILLPLRFPTAAEARARGWTEERVRIWGAAVPALNLEKELPEGLGEYLGVSGRLGLFRADPARRREVLGNAPAKSVAGYQPAVDFHDEYPASLMNMHSVQDVDAHVPKDEGIQEVDIRRYRANIIITGVPPFEEETWKHIRLRPSPSSSTTATTTTTTPEFFVACRTIRCKLPNVHPTTGLRHDAQPERALRAYRNVDPGAPNKGCLGMQMCACFSGDHDDGGGKEGDVEGVRGEGEEGEGRSFVVEVGMEIEVTEHGEHVFLG